MALTFANKEIVQIWTSGRCPVGDGQKMHGGRATKDTEKWGRESEEEESSDERDRAGKRRKLGNKGMTVLVVWRLVRQKTQG